MQNKNFLAHYSAVIFLCLYSQALSAQPAQRSEQIVISATKSERPINKTASSVRVIDSAELEKKQAASISEILDKQPELDVVSTGTKGSSTTVSIRGANPEHTLVVLDGIELNNPILPSRSFNFADLQLNSVKRIEILRGAQSTLYGSDAMAGVIDITSEKSTNDFEYSALSEAGSYSSFLEQVGVAGNKQAINYGLSVLREDTHGISAADSRLGNSEADGYANSSYFARFGFAPEEAFDFNTILRAIDSKSELDNFGGSFADDTNRVQKNNQYFWGSSINSDFLDKKIKSVISYSLSDQRFSDDNDPDSINLDTLRSNYQGLYQAVKLKLDYQATDSLHVISGVDHKTEEGESKYLSDGAFGIFESNFESRSTTTNGVFSQAVFDLSDKAAVTSGIRIDNQSAFGSRTTWQVAPVVNFEQTGLRLFSTAGTGYKAPSLFQLYSVYGSSELEAEKSLAVDVGFDQQIIEDRLSLRMTYFNQDFDNLIDFDPNTFVYSNINSATTQGLENELLLTLCENLSLNLAYTYLDATNDDSGEALLRRARHKFAADLSYQQDMLSVTIQTNYRGRSYDNDYSNLEVQRSELAGYNLVDILASYQLSDNFRIFSRVENIFDQNYQEVLGYGTYGIAAFAGIELKG